MTEVLRVEAVNTEDARRWSLRMVKGGWRYHIARPGGLSLGTWLDFVETEGASLEFSAGEQCDEFLMRQGDAVVFGHRTRSLVCSKVESTFTVAWAELHKPLLAALRVAVDARCHFGPR